jgi:DNA-binding NarL/FixJ family response regulator
MSNILLVEDSPILRDSIESMLADEESLEITNYAVTSADAIEILNQKQFDIVIADIELARGNGFEVVQHILGDDYVNQPPQVIMLTNHSNPYYKNLAKKLGVQYFYDKSMEFDEAMQTIIDLSKPSHLN